MIILRTKLLCFLAIVFCSPLLSAGASLAAETCQTFEGPAVWTGECRKGVAQGSGRATYDGGYVSTVDGVMIDGTPTGEVTVQYSDGGYYVGEMRDGEPYGYGLSMEAWGEGYQGNWVEGFRDGEGEYISADGRKVPGVWRRGRLIGSWYVDAESGCSIWWAPENDPVGSLNWSGECVDGKGHGEGRLDWTLAKGDRPAEKSIVFDGRLVDGIIQGQGAWRKIEKYVNVTNEITYQGSWVDGQRSGAGVETSNVVSRDGSPDIEIREKYDGEWKNDSYWGVGVYEKRRRSGSESAFSLKERGAFAAGRLHGEGQREAVRNTSETDKTIEKETGIFVQGELGGPGVQTYESFRQGKRYYQRIEGSWAQGGVLQGVAEYADGATFRGVFSGYGPIPFQGECEFPEAGFSGPCEAHERDTSEFSGETCLVPQGRKEPCLTVISSWIS